MAQRRMISKKISTSTRLSECSTFTALLYTWLIPHCDDFGRMDGAPKVVKAIVVPLRDESVQQVEESLKELEKMELITRYVAKERPYLSINQWEKHQTFKTDRSRHSEYPPNPADSRRKPEGENVRLSEVKLSEDKRREEKPHSSLSYLEKIPAEDLKQLSEKYKIAERGIKSKAYDLALYCQYKGRKCKNYKAFLENALRKDAVQLRNEYPSPRVAVVAPPEKPETPEEKERREKKMEEIREGMKKLGTAKSV